MLSDPPRQAGASDMTELGWGLRISLRRLFHLEEIDRNIGVVKDILNVIEIVERIDEPHDLLGIFRIGNRR